MKRVLISLFVLMCTAVTVFACPNCKDGFGSGTGNASIGDAYSMSVLFMLGVPLTLLTVFTIVIARRLRGADKP